MNKKDTKIVYKEWGRKVEYYRNKYNSANITKGVKELPECIIDGMLSSALAARERYKQGELSLKQYVSKSLDSAYKLYSARDAKKEQNYISKNKKTMELLVEKKEKEEFEKEEFITTSIEIIELIKKVLTKKEKFIYELKYGKYDYSNIKIAKILKTSEGSIRSSLIEVKEKINKLIYRT